MSRKIQRILAPTDFSPSSDAALHDAAFLAQQLEADLELMHVWMPSTVAQTIASDHGLAEMEHVARKTLTRKLERAAREIATIGTRVTTKLVLRGEPAWDIVREAKAGKYDLIVMGTHGRTGLARAFLGSVAEAVVRKAPCPVLTVKKPTKAKTG